MSATVAEDEDEGGIDREAGEPPIEPEADDPGGPGGGRRGPTEDDWAACPVQPLGHRKGQYQFLTSSIEHRALKARDLFSKPELLALFGGDDRWLKQHFATLDDDGKKKLSVHAAAQALQRRCHRAGLFDPERTEIRQAGIWADEDGRPLIHLGDKLATADGRLLDVGRQASGVIYEGSAARRRPGPPCSAAVIEDVRAEMADLWLWRDGPAGARLALGWLAAASLGAAARWRPNLFLLGESGSGKSELLYVLRDALVVHSFSNDTTRAGLVSDISGRPGPVLVEEATQGDKATGRALMDLMLPAAGGDGARGLRGAPDGVGRRFTVIGSVCFGAVHPPPMQPEHQNRFTELNLLAPPAGQDHTDAMLALRRRVRGLAPAILGRVMAGFARWAPTLSRMRAGLVASGASPRDADQIGALLAGWWLLASDDPPTESEAADLLGEMAAYLPRREERREDSAARRAWLALATTRVQLAAGQTRRPIGDLVMEGHSPFPDLREAARQELKAWGIGPDEITDVTEAARYLRDPPLDPPGGWPLRGVWFLRRHKELQGLFEKTEFGGDAWFRAMQVQPGAWRSAGNVRVGQVSTGGFFVSALALAGVQPPAPPVLEGFESGP